MIANSEPIDAKIEQLIKTTVPRSVGPLAIKGMVVRAGEDHDGDPVIFIEISYNYSEAPIDMRTFTDGFSSMLTGLRGKLLEKGETRFPHIRNKFDERQQVARRQRTRA